MLTTTRSLTTRSCVGSTTGDHTSCEQTDSSQRLRLKWWREDTFDRTLNLSLHTTTRYIFEWRRATELPHCMSRSRSSCALTSQPTGEWAPRVVRVRLCGWVNAERLRSVNSLPSVGRRRPNPVKFVFHRPRDCLVLPRPNACRPIGQLSLVNRHPVRPIPARARYGGTCQPLTYSFPLAQVSRPRSASSRRL